MLLFFLMKSVIASRLSKAWSVIRTSKAMLLPEFYRSLSERHHAALLGVFHAPPDASDRFGPLQTVQYLLIAPGILNDQLGAPVDCEHERCSLFLQPAHIVPHIALEVVDGANFFKVDHRGASCHPIRTGRFHVTAGVSDAAKW